MPCFPQPGSVTVCEINRDLITSEKLSDDQAKATYGKILGVVFSPIAFQPGLFLYDSEQNRERERENGEVVRTSGIAAILTLVGDSFKRALSHKILSDGITQVNVQVRWHPHKHILAFISSPNQVTIYDYDDSEGKEPIILTNESLGNITAIEWRPKGGRMLAVACKRGITIWSSSYPGNVAPLRSGVSSVVGITSRGSGTRWTLVDLLHNPDCNEKIISLSWNPNGRLLASASSESSSFTIWDVAQGVSTPIRRGLSNISMLKWSPLGDYFFTAKIDGSFYLWETYTWTSELWSSSDGYVTGASWDPNSRMIMMAFSNSITLGSVHFASKPPSLDAHLLPVDLPEFSAIGSNGITDIAWDASGERLAVSYKGGDELYNGLVAIYDVSRRGPLVSASLVGFIRGPGENAHSLAFAFHDQFTHGPLLSVCWSSGWCCTYPLIFKSQVIS
ncbi:hypothetical protein ZOSMA_6G00180 [Zostera marina]|uniref:Aladin seven-bladed propeller domain-containing protein n=1 Tax=Zostera marina TaxID=29655 RepID=A0A0K9NSY7_ZOSMR|nr:hypothetical protein ZOSMA_6G00180 [Zostera marina]